MVRIDRDMDEAALRRLAEDEGLDEKSANEVIEAGLVSDSLHAEVALPAPDVTAAIAKSAVKTGQIVVTPGGSVVDGALQARGARPRPSARASRS